MKVKPVLLIIGLLFWSCNKKSNEFNPNDSGLIVKSGYVCGWGTGTDTIEISKSEIRYVYYVPRFSGKPQIIKSRPVPATEWNEIKSIVNFNDFSRLTYNSCNICVDGCDEWILILESDRTHKITFQRGAKIDSINKLQLKLAKLRTEFFNQ
jgi:hypothetical protein